MFAGLTAIVLACAPTPTQVVPNIPFVLHDLLGSPHDLGRNDARRLRVFTVLGTECPVSNAYTPTLSALAATFVGRPVDLYGVVSDSGITRSAAAKHYAEFRAGFPVLFDPSGLLRDALKPTHVPEAFVLDQDGAVAYRGAIDNGWETPGRRRAAVEKHYLADAVTAVLKGEPPAVARTPAVGCPVEEAAPRPVTYARDIAPILQARCVTCHRPGQAAPFVLTSFDAAAKRAKQLAAAAENRTMPPWVPAPGHARFVGERVLTDRELQLLAVWAETGKAKGADADLPPPPVFADGGWRLGQPDLVVSMTEPFPVPADGPDLLQNFVIPLPVDSDKLVAAVEFRPGNPRVAHHAVLFLDASGTARKLDAKTPEPGYPNFGGPGFLPSGALGGWSVGNTARALPNGMGRYLKKGSDLVLQMHYHPTGKAETDRSEIALYFVKKPVAESLKEKAKLVGSIWLANYDIDIPAGAADYRRTARYTLPKDVTMVGVVPHMHLLGKAMTVTATLPDGTARTLIDVKHWNYNWQDEYYYERPFKLPAGTVLTVSAAFDNSTANPINPSAPPRRVTYGEGTLDEMLFCFFLLTADRAEDLMHVVLDNLGHDMKQPRGNK